MSRPPGPYGPITAPDYTRRYSRAFYADRVQFLRRLKDKPCLDCGKRYPHYVMDFDHRDPTQKRFTPSGGFVRRSLKSLQQEVDKCDVVCANCHRERTYKTRRIIL